MNKYILTTLSIGMLSISLTACKTQNPSSPSEITPSVNPPQVSASQIPNQKPSSYTAQPLSSINKTAKKVSLSKLHKAVKKAYGKNYIPNMALDKKTLQEVYGLSPNLYQNAIGEVPMISTHSDTFIAVKAKKGKTKAVKKALTNYQTKLKKDTMQYPMNQLKIQASKVVSYDNYVFFILLGQLPKNTDETNESKVINAFEKQNNIAIKAIKKTLGI